MYTVRAKLIAGVNNHFIISPFSAVLLVSAVSCDEPGPVISRPERRSDSDASSAVKIFDSYRKGSSHRQSTCTVNSPYYCGDEHQSCCTANNPSCCPVEIGGCCTSTRPFCCADGESCCRAGYNCCPGGPNGEVTHCCRSDTVCCGTTCCESRCSRAIAVGVTAMAAIGWLMVILVHISIMY